MPVAEGFVTILATKEARKKLKVLSAEREQPMCGILSALIDYAVSSPEFLAELLHPAHETQRHDN